MTKSIAIIGAGYMAEEHIKAFNALPGIIVAGITSRTFNDAKKLAETYGIDVVADDITSLYKATKADGVVVAVNELSTQEVIRQCMSYPWSVLCEKPLGLYINDTQSIADEAKASGTNIFIAMNRRHFESTNTALNYLNVDDGRRFVEVHDQENMIGALKGGQPIEVVSRWMVANSIHLIDYFSIFCRGNIERIETPVELDNKTPFIMQKTIYFSSGDIGVYTAVWNAPGPWAVKVTTPTQMLEMRPVEKLEHQIFPEKQRKTINLSDVDIKFKAGLYSQALQFRNHLNKSSHNLPNLENYILSHQLVESLYPQSLEVIEKN